MAELCGAARGWGPTAKLGRESAKELALSGVPGIDAVLFPYASHCPFRASHLV